MIKISPKMPIGKYVLKKGENHIFNILLLISALGGKIDISAKRDFVLSIENKAFSAVLKKAGFCKNFGYRHNAVAFGIEYNLENCKGCACEIAALFAFLHGESKLFNLNVLHDEERKLLFLLLGNLKSMGANIKICDNFISFGGRQVLGGARVYAYGNSRILGILAAVASRCEGEVFIKGYNVDDKKTGDILNVMNDFDMGASISEFNKKNIVLTGMSGGGKTTVGRLLAKMMNMEFVDTDEVFENEEKKTISLVFEEKGEKYFRKREAEVIKKVSQKNGAIISTGGGAVLNSENIKNLKNNGIIFYINRDIKKILSCVCPDGRPLFKNGKKAVVKLFESRKEIYEKTADYIVKNNDVPEEAAKKICDIYKSEMI